MAIAAKLASEIATIDVVRVEIENQAGTKAFAIQTASQIAVEPQIETEDPIKLVVKGRLIAQKGEVSTYTGTQITLTDNVFSPEIVQMLQGGTIEYDTSDPTKIIGYTPPVAGSTEKGEVCTLRAYSAQYDASAVIQRYECIEYPNCQGVPVGFGSEDNAFRVPEYTINSAPATGQPPYKITYMDTLPELSGSTGEDTEI